MKMSKDCSALNSPELGRYAQMFIQQAIQIENRAERQIAIEKIIDTQLEIGQIAPKLREETKLKIWMQILFLFGTDLRVDLPENLPLNANNSNAERVTYPQKQQNNRDYGLYFQQFVEKVATMPAEDKPEAVKTLVAYMRLIHQNIHNEEISNQQIKTDLHRLSQGRIQINLENLGEHSHPNKPQQNKHPNFQKKPKSFKK